VDIEQKYNIVEKLWENGVFIFEIRFCPDVELASIARRLGIKPDDLATFAEEVAKRSRHRAAQKQQFRALTSEVTVLFTDDRSCVSEAMEMQGVAGDSLTEYLPYLKTGYSIEFRIRDQELAERCSRVISQKVEATNKPLPPLKKGDIVMLFQEHQPDDMPIVQRLPYRP